VPSTSQYVLFSPESPTSVRSSLTADSPSTAPTTPPPRPPLLSKHVPSLEIMHGNAICSPVVCSPTSLCSIPASDISLSLGGSMIFTRNAQANDGSAFGTYQRYIACLALAPGLQELLGDGELVPGGHPSNLTREFDASLTSAEDSTVRSASDFSYSAHSYAGPGYRIVGDAGGTFSHFSFCFLVVDIADSIRRPFLFFGCTSSDELSPISGDLARGVYPSRVRREGRC
jgi:hypothetical protein